MTYEIDKILRTYYIQTISKFSTVFILKYILNFLLQPKHYLNYLYKKKNMQITYLLLLRQTNSILVIEIEKIPASMDRRFRAPSKKKLYLQ